MKSYKCTVHLLFLNVLKMNLRVNLWLLSKESNHLYSSYKKNQIRFVMLQHKLLPIFTKGYILYINL